MLGMVATGHQEPPRPSIFRSTQRPRNRLRAGADKSQMVERVKSENLNAIDHLYSAEFCCESVENGMHKITLGNVAYVLCSQAYRNFFKNCHTLTVSDSTTMQ